MIFGCGGEGCRIYLKKISLLLFLYERGRGEDNLFKQEF
jgi:hypothetical protein